MFTNKGGHRPKQALEVRIAQGLIYELLNLAKAHPRFFRNILVPELKSLKWKSGPPDLPLGNNVFARRIDGFWIIYEVSVGHIRVVVVEP